jgi:hypothetical protein
MSEPTGQWKVLTATVEELEATLNALAQDGYAIHSIMPLGAPEPLSNVPREHKSLAQRATFAIVGSRNAR